jgi:Protein of unknown function (DUF3048) N-terminal domain/Protein of unknown function (DUF3048) C-terminal domain
MHARGRGARRLFVTSALVVLGSVAAACGGGDDAADTTTSSSPPTTEATTTTTAATTTTVAATTTTEAPEPVYPLTGLPIDDPTRANSIALVVKIDNAPPARPQSGLGQADLVVEEIVNDGLTRFGMVFHQFDADPVGPIRSGRLQDIDLFSALNKPLFAWSGGNPTVTAAIRASDLRDIGPSRAGGAYYRENGRRVPHNLYSNTPRLRQEAPLDAAPPPQWFQYRDGDTEQGSPSAGIATNLDSINVVWTWNATTGLYEREMEGRPHEDRETGLITTDNVVVLVVEYLPGISGSPDAQTLGTGEVFVHTGGRVIAGTWSRSDIRTPFDLRDADGEPILLTPGRTFIELPRPGNTLPLPAA